MPESIESIARSRERWVEANRENEFEAGFKRLLTELYPDNAHFIYELLQNAEDARAHEVRFILHDDRIEFEHDGAKLFSLNDVKAITGIGFSTKRKDTNIGKFGVGFKAVFAYTETPEVLSGDFHFRILDMVVPKPDRSSGNQSKDGKTRFVLPFDNPKKPKDTARIEIETLLRALDAATLLFLSRIRKIEYLLPDSSLGYIERIQLDDHRFEIRVQHPDETSHSSTWFIKLDKEVRVEDDEVEDETHKVKICRIAVAFAIARVEVDSKKTQGGSPEEGSQWELAPIEHGRVCIYFPADKETSKLRFHVHAPFASTVARDSVRDCVGNHALRDHLADLLADSMHLIRDQGMLTVRALGLLPNDRDILTKLYEPLLTRLIQEFQEEDLVPLKRGGHAAASGIVRGAKALSDLIDDEDLATLLRDEEIPPEWAANPSQRNQREDNFLSMLEIDEWTDDDLAQALLEMDEEARSSWMKSKDDAWHQKLYALLEDKADILDDAEIVKTSDGNYRAGSECFFPTEDTEHDDQFPRVAKRVFSSGKSKDQQSRARSFVSKLGVREVDEKVEIEVLLRRHYAEESARPNRKAHYSHLRRFIRFLDNNPDRIGLFHEAHLFMVDREEDVEWMTTEKVYLDAPYMKSGLKVYYDQVDFQNRKYPLAKVYAKPSAKLPQIMEFAERLGVATVLQISKSMVLRSHPEWKVLSRHGGERWRIRTDEDYHIPCLATFLKHPAIEKSRLVWRTMNRFCEASWCDYLKARFGKNRSNVVEAKSTLVHDLIQAKWVPQARGKKCVFVQPRDAEAEKLPRGFRFDSGSAWLQALAFGEGVEEKREAQRLDRLRQKEEYRQKEQILKEVGFDSPKEAEEVASLKKEDPEGYKKWRDSRKAKPEFPERPSADPIRRGRKAAEAATNSTPKEYEKKPRSIRTRRTQGKAEVDAYLRSAYTDDDRLFCQLCRDEMPFRKKDGNHYFVRTEAFNLPKEHDANHLALCPVCAAKYHEFVVHGADNAHDQLRERFLDMDGELKLPVTLGEQTAEIRFVETHAIDLREAVISDPISLDTN